MKPNTYKIIQECIDNGITLGYNRAHKHTDSPTEEVLKGAINDALMSEICEWFIFEEFRE